MPEGPANLFPLLSNPAELLKEYKRRKTDFDVQRVANFEVDAMIEKGWSVHRKLKRSVIVIKERPLDERLENKFWNLLYKMGYSELNKGRKFNIQIARFNDVSGKKQIDVFAKDEETIIVAECKSSSELRSRSLQKDIEEFGALKKDIANAIRQFYGQDFKPKILWFFVTQNIIWSKEDQDRAHAHQIRKITELEFPYYTKLAEHLGKAARFQFLAEFLKDQAIPELSGVKVPATRGKLGGRYFYSFVTTPRHLLKIAYINHRNLNDPEGYPTYQRLIQKSRLKDVAEYIKVGGYFPNNLLINFVKPPRFDVTLKDGVNDVHYGSLYLPDTYKSAWVIDGQHRLYGYANLEDKYQDSKLIVVAFEEMPKKEEAELFVTINHEQKSVSKTLLDDLEGELKWDSVIPSERIGAIAARLIQALNQDLSSPFYDKFAAEGMPSTTKLTIPQVKLALRRSNLLGEPLLKDTHYDLGPLCGKSSNSTLLRAQIILNSYFDLIKEADPARWVQGRAGKICMNEGIQGFILLLGQILLYQSDGRKNRYLTMTEAEVIFEVLPILEPVLKFIRSKNPGVEAHLTVQYGGNAPRDYLFKLCRLIKAEFPNFSPDEYDDWEVTQSEELRQIADNQLQAINKIVQKYIFDVFKRLYGDEGNAYWERGIINKELKKNAYSKSLDENPDERLPLETYLDFIEYKKIVEGKEYWPLFKSVFDIPEVKGISKNITWMDRINELRRIPSHASEKRKYKVEDFPFIEKIYQTLQTRIAETDLSEVSPVTNVEVL